MSYHTAQRIVRLEAGVEYSSNHIRPPLGLIQRATRVVLCIDCEYHPRSPNGLGLRWREDIAPFPFSPLRLMGMGMG